MKQAKCPINKKTNWCRWKGLAQSLRYVRKVGSAQGRAVWFWSEVEVQLRCRLRQLGMELR